MGGVSVSDGCGHPLDAFARVSLERVAAALDLAADTIRLDNEQRRIADLQLAEEWADRLARLSYTVRSWKGEGIQAPCVQDLCAGLSETECVTLKTLLDGHLRP